jgi:predicted nucleotidyltransferase
MIPVEKCGLTAETQSKLMGVFKDYPSVQKVILYGSRAKGNFKPGSDIDITLIAPDSDLTDLFKIENQIDDLLLPYKLDISLFHQIDNASLIAHIKRVGIEFYSRA